jgi:hypothetical protein
MTYFTEPESIKNLKKCIADISDEDIVVVSTAVYCCLELFKTQYEDISHWKNASSNQIEWFGCLAILAKDILVKEILHELPFGTTNGVYMTLLFFKSVAVNEDERTINAMSECLEEFSRIGYQISNRVEPKHIFKLDSKKPKLGASKLA